MSEGRKKICMIVPRPDVQGGIASVVSNYYGSRLEEDFDVTYVQSYRDGSKIRKLLQGLKAYREFRRILKKDRPDLVHIHSSFGPSFYRKMPFILMAHHAGIPVINHIHGSAMDVFYDNASPLKKKLVRRIYSLCSCIITLTPYWQEKIRQIVPGTPVEVVSNYSVLHEETAGPGCRKSRFAGKKVLFLGKIDEAKGVFEVPEIMKKVCAEIPETVFCLAGSGDLAGVRDQTDESLRANLALPGWIVGEEKERQLRESCIFLLPSHMEAMPMSALDAMGYGLPVISTNAGGIPAVVEDGRNGFLYAVKDTDGMAEGILKLLKDEKLWEKMSDESLKIVRERFSFEKHIEKIEELYRRYPASERDGQEN